MNNSLAQQSMLIDQGDDYVDGRYSARPEGLEANLGRMPAIQVGESSIGQSAAVNFYVASENGLLGSSNLEAAQIIAIAEHIKEMNKPSQAATDSLWATNSSSPMSSSTTPSVRRTLLESEAGELPQRKREAFGSKAVYFIILLFFDLQYTLPTEEMI